MAMTLPNGEPEAGPWRALDGADLISEILDAAGKPSRRPRIVAVDGRGASGKSTLADYFEAEVPGARVVHTDDVAWHESFFGWGHLLRDNVLRVVHAGRSVRFRPPAWQQRGRQGVIEVPADTSLLVIEGVGASQREFADLIDATIWVQSDFAEAERRGIQRDIASGVNGDREQTIAFWHEWMDEEIAFLNQQRPWERADLIVAGTPVLDLADGQWAIAERSPIRESPRGT